VRREIKKRTLMKNEVSLGGIVEGLQCDERRTILRG
jgi:hypothetical protein